MSTTKEATLMDWFRRIGTQLSSEDYEEGIRLIAAVGQPAPSARVTLFTVRRIPKTAGAKMSAGYEAIDFEIEATDGPTAIGKAVDMCEWNRPWDNFAWRVVGSRQGEVKP